MRRGKGYIYGFKSKPIRIKQIQGFTLMEVLVCIAMVGILFTPMLTLFSHSLKTNINSKDMQRATTLTEQVMEEVRSYTSTQAMVNGTSWKRTQSNFKDSITDTVLTETNGDYKNEKYYFVMDSLKSDEKDYVAHITVDCSKYHGDDTNEKKALSNLPILESLGSDNSVLAVEANETAEVLNIFQQKYSSTHGGSTITIEELAKHLEKTIKVEIVDSAKDNGVEIIPENMVRIQVYNEYTITGVGLNETITSDRIYNDVVYYDNLKSVYLFYSYDMYQTTGDIFQGIDIDVNFTKAEHAAWDAGFTFYAVYQHAMIFDENGNHIATGDEEQVLDQGGKMVPKIKRKIKGNYISTSDQKNMPIVSNLAYQIYNGSTYEQNTQTTQTAIDDFVETESVQRFADVKVELYSVEDSKIVCTMESTVAMGSARGE